MAFRWGPMMASLSDNWILTNLEKTKQQKTKTIRCQSWTNLIFLTTLAFINGKQSCKEICVTNQDYFPFH